MFSNEADDDFLYWFSRIVYPFFSIGIIGNLLIIIYHMNRNWGNLRGMRAYDFFIMQLAFADLVVCVTTPAMRYEEQKPVFQAGHFTCKYIRPSTLLVAPMASCWILVGLSFFRYLILRRPFNFRRRISKTHIAIICFVLWLLSAVYYYMAFDSNGINENDQCDYGKIYKNMDAMLVFIFIFERFLDCFLPTIIMTVCYRSIRHHMFAAAAAIIPAQMRMRRVRAMQTLKWLIICYVVFVFPGRTLVTIFRLMNHFKMAFHDDEDKLILDVVYHCMLFCINLNNMVNVFIFLKMDGQFRQFLSTPFIRFGLWLRRDVAVPVGNAFNRCVGVQPQGQEAPLAVIVNPGAGAAI